jgi:hypothetical protein
VLWFFLKLSDAYLCNDGFYCLKIYDAKQIINWTDEEETALCFNCGVDSVVGDSTGFPVEDHDFLKKMHSRYF